MPHVPLEEALGGEVYLDPAPIRRSFRPRGRTWRIEHEEFDNRLYRFTRDHKGRLSLVSGGGVHVKLDPADVIELVDKGVGYRTLRTRRQLCLHAYDTETPAVNRWLTQPSWNDRIVDAIRH